MDVTSTSTSSSQPTTTLSSSQSGATIDYDSFLKLLLAEMKNQDPTEPTDTSDYVAQFATFSQVEQGMQTNSKLDSMLSSLALSQADGLIGRTVTSEDGKTSGEVKSVRIVSGGAVADLTNGGSVSLVPGVVIS